ncbi:glycoside hydrolase family 2 protein [Pedosphaera parvula]|uniref:Glycoside hydrolase family 2 sugar binding n=1 Tax=Pedosphaera parvula (strain Ellin514) TaxID=320771 RepID=B9XB03_PEDPL|nr:glycoside hydrolase family 2 [Pedosphaera parvula]EEF63188.1 glycoside hydrolase family 2 sugar binding [Pedosphaera parvula Ellin514]
MAKEKKSGFRINRVTTRATVAAWVMLMVFGVVRTVVAEGWEVAKGPLMTRWAKEVNPTNAHPEYPRPQLVRADWLNLNGLWDYAITPGGTSEVKSYQGKILVPYPLESALSGVMKHLDETNKLWYRRTFTVPREWSDRHVRLNFGAVDWQTWIYVNGKEVGAHRGGYDAFSFDISEYLKREGEEEIEVAVMDPTEGDQPRGKQSRKPEGIFYTPTSGIWQTVWLEPVSKVCIDNLKLVPDIDAQVLTVKAGVNSLAENVMVEAVALAGGKEVGRVVGLANKELSLRINAPHLWTPQDPFLYDLQVTLRQGGRKIDSVDSYFGMRKVSLRKDSRGITRIALNDVPIFQIGTLDQGFWPDGIYTAPTDEALRYDIEFLKQAGFNLTRKHVKVEPDRWYYWCDKLGLFVWQDMPSGNNGTPEGRAEFEGELRRMLQGLRNHPSIVMWVLFNEGWSQYDTERLVQWIKTLDPTRLVDNASGWTDKHTGDVVDAHSYPGPEAVLGESGRAAVLGEFGGLGLGMEGHQWSKQSWGYQIMGNVEALNERYCALMKRVWTFHEYAGLSAAVYTQTTDVETECNGLLTYDRAVAKIDLKVAQPVTSGARREASMQIVMPDALCGMVTWKYSFEVPDTNWMMLNYDAANWKEGPAGFGTFGTPGSMVHTKWNTSDIWLRREFTVNERSLDAIKFELHHDEDVEVYLNGVLAAQASGFVTDYYQVEPFSEAAATLHQGTNLIAVHCHQTGGGQYVDVGIVRSETLPAANSKK